MCLDCYQMYHRLLELEKPVIRGGKSILWGNLAPYGAVVKNAAVAREMYFHVGPARVFDNENDAVVAFSSGDIKPKEIVTIRYIGKKGGPGMPEILMTTALLVSVGHPNNAIITDGRISGGSRGPCIVHVDPEAMDRGPIGVVKNGDIISYDILRGWLYLEIPYEELITRLENWFPSKKELMRLEDTLKQSPALAHYVARLPPSHSLEKLKNGILKFYPEKDG